jgi:hypothetical protein
MPNLLLDVRPDGALILQVTPLAPGRCRVRRFDFGTAGGAPRDPWLRRVGGWLKQQIEVAESTQAGLSAAPEDTHESGPLVPVLARFREAIAALLEALPANAGQA